MTDEATTAVKLLTARSPFESKITIYGGRQLRPFIHVSDAADAFILALQASIKDVKGEIDVGQENEQPTEMIVHRREEYLRNYHVRFFVRTTAT